MEGLAEFPDNITFPKPLSSSKGKFCSVYGLPPRQAISNEELDDAQEEHANMAMDNGFTC